MTIAINTKKAISIMVAIEDIQVDTQLTIIYAEKLLLSGLRTR